MNITRLFRKKKINARGPVLARVHDNIFMPAQLHVRSPVAKELYECALNEPDVSMAARLLQMAELKEYQADPDRPYLVVNVYPNARHFQEYTKRMKCEECPL